MQCLRPLTAGGMRSVPKVVAAVVAALLLLWAAVVLVDDSLYFAVLAPQAHSGVEAMGALARLFAALVLFMFPLEQSASRFQWTALGLVVLGLGSLMFGYLEPALRLSTDLNTSMYASLVTRSAAGLAFVMAFAPSRPRPLSWRSTITLLAIFAFLSLTLVRLSAHLPVLVRIDSLEAAASRGETPLHGLTAWHWGFSLVPLALSLLAVWAASRRAHESRFDGWMLVAMVLLAGSQLHNLFWPSVYSPILTTADVIRLIFAAVVVVGAIIELRRIAVERSAMLVTEQAHSRRLTELAMLRADFTAMVGHELGNPLMAIRALSNMIATGELDRDEQIAAARSIQAEAEAIAGLITDVQAAATTEQEGFAVRLRPVPVSALVEEAADYGRTLPGAHAVSTRVDAREMVLADAERIGQVLRNLVGNAAKYSPDGSPIEIVAVRRGDRVRIEVMDRGYGIDPDDQQRIFEKFGRGRDRSGKVVAGVGLGLYLSRRIVQAHGSDLVVKSNPEAGSTFSFDLETVR